MIQNPKYKGKWKPPLIDNPDYMVSETIVHKSLCYKQFLHTLTGIFCSMVDMGFGIYCSMVDMGFGIAAQYSRHGLVAYVCFSVHASRVIACCTMLLRSTLGHYHAY